MKTTKFKIITVAAVLCLALIAGAAVAVYAKYIGSDNSHVGVVAEGFVFVSDYLVDSEKAEMPEYTVYGESVTFTVSNFETEKNISEVDISYTVTATGSGWTSEKESYTLPGNDASTEAFTVNGNPGDVFEIWAVSQSAYKKSLCAKFVFAAYESYYTVTDGERFVQIDVYTADAVDGITVGGTEGLIPDNTNDDFNGSDIGALAADSHYTFVYFKTEDKAYTAVEKTPLANEITLTQSSN